MAKNVVAALTPEEMTNLQQWMVGLDRLFRKLEKTKFHGSVRVVFNDGGISRLLIESSVVDPATLARDETPPF